MKAFFADISASNAYSSLTTASYKETYQSIDKNDTILGTKDYAFALSKSDDVYYLYENSSFTGDQIVDNVVKQEHLIRFDGQEYKESTKKVTDKDSVTTVVMSEDDARLAVQDKVYYESNGYNTGGLYFGDIFMINSNVFPNEAFVINDDKTTMSFIYKYAKQFTNSSNESDYLDSDQNTCMNKNGLIIKATEKVRIESSGLGGINVAEATYNGVISQKTSI